MATELPGLRVKISADYADFKRGMDDVAQRVAKVGSVAMTAVKAVFAIGAAVGAAGAALVYFTKSSADAAREITNMSRVSGTTTQDFQRLAFAASSVGIQGDKLADIFKDVRDRVGDFMQTGGGPMADFFEKIAPKVGVTADQFAKLSGPQALQLYVDSLEKANVSSQDMVFYLEAMASDTTALLPLLENGGAGMARLAQEAEALGIVMSDYDISALQDFGFQFDKIQAIIKGVKNALAVELAPILSVLTEDVTALAVQSGGWGNIMDKAIKAVAYGIAHLLQVVYNFRAGLHVINITVAYLRKRFAEFIHATAAGFAEMIDTITGKINTMIGGLNSVSPIEIPLIPEMKGADWIRSLELGVEEATAKTREALAGAKDFMNDTTKPLEYVDELFRRVEERKAQLAADGGWLPTTAGDGTSNGGDNKEAEKLREKMMQRLEAIRESLMSERELEIAKHAQTQEDLIAALEMRLLTEDEYRVLREEAEAQHLQRLTEMEQKAANERAKIEERHTTTVNAMRRSALNEAVNLLNMFAGESKAAAIASIALQKGVAIAETVMQTQVAQMRALAELGPIAGAPVAAKIATMGAVSVGLIAAQGIAQAASALSGGGASSIGAGTPAGGGGSANQPAMTQQQQQQPAFAGTLTVQGVNNQTIMVGNNIRDFAEQLLDYQRSGGRVVWA